ncbi:B12-binding domain-containing radical SAM protein [Poriferisphaera sp. WC338]|uniref:B12-binding domain-containing radical SAM protein n=1 Tax=Poriferisphaera sp. WC338 TaxID=3425129 RepID=UPI003D818F1B
MKVLLIKASNDSDFKRYKKYVGSPPQNIFSAAAALPQGIKFEMVDETSGSPARLKTDADVVGIFASTPDAMRMYELADAYRKRGKIVVLGGLHATFLPEEAAGHADAVIVGESEGLWEDILADACDGKMKARYERDKPVDLRGIKDFPLGKISADIYKGLWSVLVSRGCGFNCAFCTVRVFGGAQRWRPVKEVAREIAACGYDWVELHSDNLTFDRDYAMALFKEIKPLGINWVGETTITMADDEELLDAAVDSGMRYMLAGLETPSQSALKGVGKGFVSVDKVKDQVARLHERNVMVDSCILFGFDQHDTDIFQQSLDYVDEVDVDVVTGVIMTPYPGTRLYKKLESEGRILTKNWSLYDGSHAVFKPMGMSAAELEEGAGWFTEKYYDTWRYIKRKAKHVKRFGIGNAIMLTP